MSKAFLCGLSLITSLFIKEADSKTQMYFRQRARIRCQVYRLSQRHKQLNDIRLLSKCVVSVIGRPNIYKRQVWGKNDKKHTVKISQLTHEVQICQMYCILNVRHLFDPIFIVLDAQGCG